MSPLPPLPLGPQPTASWLLPQLSARNIFISWQWQNATQDFQFPPPLASGQHMTVSFTLSLGGGLSSGPRSSTCFLLLSPYTCHSLSLFKRASCVQLCLSASSCLQLWSQHFQTSTSGHPCSGKGQIVHIFHLYIIWFLSQLLSCAAVG